jgi:hypothetical protein
MRRLPLPVPGSIIAVRVEGRERTPMVWVSFVLMISNVHVVCVTRSSDAITYGKTRSLAGWLLLESNPI